MQINVRPTDPSYAPTNDTRDSERPRPAPQAIEPGGVAPALVFILVATAFIAFNVFLFRPALTGPDAHGYFMQTRLLAETRGTGFTPGSPVQYVGAHWLATGPDRVDPVYGPGFPALLLPGYLVAGPTGALATNLVLAVLALIAMFVLVRRLAGGWWAVAATTMLAVLPVVNQQVHWGGAHIAVTCLFLWGLVFLRQWSESGGVLPALGAGLMFGSIPAVRYPEAVLGIGFLLWLILHLGQGRRWVGSALLALVAAALPLALLLFNNQQTWGDWLTTGYAQTGEQVAFSLAHLTRNALPYLRRLLFDGAGPAFVTGAVGVMTLWFARGRRRLGLTLFIFVLAPTLIYFAYYWPPDPMSMRLLLPTLPVYIIAATLLLHLITRRSEITGAIIGTVLLLLTAVWGAPGALARVKQLSEQGQATLVITDMVKRHVPPGAVLVGTGEQLAHMDFTGDWKLADLTITAPSAPPAPGSEGTGNSDVRARIRNPLALPDYENAAGPEALRRFARDCTDWAGDSGETWWLVPDEHLERMRKELRRVGKLVEEDNYSPPMHPAGAPGGRLVLCRWTPTSRRR
jgi:hypothetical protein